jgi:hypothetical protein
LEKEEKPSTPVLFELKYANIYDKSAVTNPEFIGVNPLGLVSLSFHSNTVRYVQSMNVLVLAR